MSLYVFIFQVLQDASRAGLSIKGNQTSDGFWQFTSSAVFAATVVTTIGQMIYFIFLYTHTHTWLMWWAFTGSYLFPL